VISTLSFYETWKAVKLINFREFPNDLEMNVELMWELRKPCQNNKAYQVYTIFIKFI